MKLVSPLALGAIVLVVSPLLLAGCTTQASETSEREACMASAMQQMSGLEGSDPAAYADDQHLAALCDELAIRYPGRNERIVEAVECIAGYVDDNLGGWYRSALQGIDSISELLVDE